MRRLVLPWLSASRDTASGNITIALDNATTTPQKVTLALTEAALLSVNASTPVATLTPFDDAAGRKAKLVLAVAKDLVLPVDVYAMIGVYTCRVSVQPTD
jgi:hypothetical protein